MINIHNITNTRLTRKFALFCAVVITVLLPNAAMAESKYFPVPDLIKPNVAFWIRIYTEVSLREGLLHDREYPQITYEKIATGNRTGKARSEFIERKRKPYIDAIIAVRDSAPEKWGAVEKRVAEMFKGVPEGALEGAEERIRHQTGQRERFRQGLERSSLYLDTISVILKQHGVPDELKYLPHVESSFDAEAYSKVGAAGLWQFMRATGRGYMKIDYLFDERRDPIISTYAAAKFLRANYNMLQRWPLAVTAYNHGPNGIRRAVESVGSREIADILEKHESPTFKFASKNFYSCFVAVLQIMEDPNKYFKTINYKPRWTATSVKLPAAMTASRIYTSVGVSEQDFKRLNPSLRPVAFTQQRQIPAGHHINLPDTITVEKALAAFGRTPPARPVVAAATQQQQRERAERVIAVDADGYYTVARGDNLNSIARRLGVSMNELAAVNSITNASRIYVGQVLMIPSASAGATQIAAAPSKPTPPPVDTIVLAKAQIQPPASDTIKVPTPSEQLSVSTSFETDQIDTVLTTTPVDTTPAPPAPPKFRELRILVSSGYDTAWTRPAPVDTTANVVMDIQSEVIAETAGDTSVTASIAVDTAIITEKIEHSVAFSVAEEPKTVPAQTASSASSAGKPAIDIRFDATVYDLGMTVAPGGASVRVRVSVGETIGHLADWMRVSNDDIRRQNNLSPTTALSLGRMIDIPIKSSSNIKQFEVSRLQYHMAIEEDFFAQYDVVDFERKRVRSGDNLWRICGDARIPMWLLKKFNRNVRFYDLRIGDNLWIPKIAAKDGGEHEVSEEFEQTVTESD